MNKEETRTEGRMTRSAVLTIGVAAAAFVVAGAGMILASGAMAQTKKKAPPPLVTTGAEGGAQADRTGHRRCGQRAEASGRSHPRRLVSRLPCHGTGGRRRSSR